MILISGGKVAVWFFSHQMPTDLTSPLSKCVPHIVESSLPDISPIDIWWFMNFVYPQGNDCTDYINAVFVDGHTQVPL